MHFGTSPDKEKSVGRHAVPEDGLANFTKGIVIFGISVLPQFVDPQQPYVAQAVLMISVYAVMVFINLVVYAILAERARRFFTGPRGSQIINRATACVFFAIGFLVLGFALVGFF